MLASAMIGGFKVEGFLVGTNIQHSIEFCYILVRNGINATKWSSDTIIF